MFEGNQKNLGAPCLTVLGPRHRPPWAPTGKEKVPALPAFYSLINSLKVTGEIPSSPLITSFH